MKNSIWLISILILVALIAYAPRDKRSPRRKIADQIMIEVAAKVKKKYDLAWIGIGEGAGDLYSKFYLGFEKSDILSKDEGRAMLLDCVHELVNAINRNEAIQPYLRDRPFTEKNVDISIFAIGKDRMGFFYPLISVFSADQGRIEYLKRDPERKTGPYKEDEEETYEEALRIVEEQRSSGKPSSAV